MRIFSKNKVSFKVLYLKKVVALIVLTVVFAIILSSFFSKIYKPYISSLAIGKANNMLQQVVNTTVLEVLDTEGNSKFVNVLKGEEGRIVAVETDTVRINKVKAKFIKNIAERLKNIGNDKYQVPIFTFLNNPFLAEIGPFVNIRVRPIGTVSADFISKFESAGVNQTKHQIDIMFKCDVKIAMPALTIEHSVESSVPIAQTIIVGDVPQSYTNVSTSKENIEDTVLQLAGN